MKVRTAALLAFIILVAAFVVVQGSDDSSAAITKIIDIKGEFTLTDDITYADKSEIVIHRDAVVDIGEFTMDFGSETAITIVEKATFKCTTGSFVFGEKTTIILIGAVVPNFEDEITMRFNGTVYVSGLPAIKEGAQVTFTPNDENDPNVRLSWDNYDIIVQDPTMRHTLDKSGIHFVLIFSKFTYIATSYDESGKVYNKKVIAIYSEVTRNGADLYIDPEGIVSATFDTTSVISTDTYNRTGVVNTSKFLDTGKTTFSMDLSLMMDVTTSAQRVETERNDNGTVITSSKMTDVTLSGKMDFTVLKFLLKQGDIPPTENPHFIKNLNIRAATGDFYAEDMDDRHMTNLYLTIDGEQLTDWYLVAGFKENDVNNTLKAMEGQFDSFGLTTDYKLSMDVTIPWVVYTRDADGQIIFDAEARQLHIITDNLEVEELYVIYSMSGKITVQQLLDHSGIIKVEAQKATADIDGDGDLEMEADNLKLTLDQDARKHNTLTVEFEHAEFEDVREDMKFGTITSHFILEDSMLYLDTVGDMDEVIHAFTEGINFTTDTVAEVQISNSGFKVVSEREDGTLEATAEAMSPTSPTSITLSLGITYSQYEDRTTLSAKANAVGYSISIMDTIQHTDPVGTTYLTVISKDFTGSLDLIISDKMQYTLEVYMPWDLLVQHYDVDFRLTNNDSDFGITHGTLEIQGYDPKTEGILAIVDALRYDDFKVGGRMSFTSSMIKLSRDSVQVYDVYRDVEVTVREFNVDVTRDVEIDVDLTKLYISLIEFDGKEFEKTLKNLNIHIDETGAEPEPTFIEKTAKLFLILFAVAAGELAITLIILRIKRPHLFKFNE